MSLPVACGTQQPNPSTVSAAPLPAVSPTVANGAGPVQGTVPPAVVAPTMFSKESGAVSGAGSAHAQGLLPSQGATPAPPLPGSEPRVVDLAHPMDNPVIRPDPLATEIARLAVASEGRLTLRIDSEPMLAALVGFLREGGQIDTLTLQADFSRFSANGSRNDKKASLLCLLLERAGHLTAIDLSACELVQKDLQWLARFLSSARCTLEALHLPGCTIHDDTARELAHALRGNDSLKTFSLRAASLMPTGWTFVTAALAAGWPCIGAPMDGRRFTTIVLESARAGEVPFHLLRPILRDNKQLRELVVSCSVQRAEDPAMPEEDWNEELDQFCDALKQNHSLFVLDLSCYRMTAASLDKLILALDAHPCIESLRLGANILTPAQAESIAAIEARNALANHGRQDPYAAAALDLLVPASGGCDAGNIWPRELSDLIARPMDWRTLTMLKAGLDAAFSMQKKS